MAFERVLSIHLIGFKWIITHLIGFKCVIMFILVSSYY